jgi:hypothetical protein
MKLKILFLTIGIYFSFFSIYSEESALKKSFRGIRFHPTEKQNLKAMTISIPKLTQKIDIIHETGKYPISFFKADCQQPNECFSLLISVAIIPKRVEKYETLVSDSKEKDFLSVPKNNQKWIDNLSFKTEKMNLFLGISEFGNKTMAFYYDKKNEETYKVSVNLIFNPNFSEEDWQSILFNVFLIYDSINIK